MNPYARWAGRCQWKVLVHRNFYRAVAPEKMTRSVQGFSAIDFVAWCPFKLDIVTKGKVKHITGKRVDKLVFIDARVIG
jgi:hypothetical protein